MHGSKLTVCVHGSLLQSEAPEKKPADFDNQRGGSFNDKYSESWSRPWKNRTERNASTDSSPDRVSM